MNNEQPARIIFEFLCNGKLSINWSGLTQRITNTAYNRQVRVAS